MPGASNSFKYSREDNPRDRRRDEQRRKSRSRERQRHYRDRSISPGPHGDGRNRRSYQDSDRQKDHRLDRRGRSRSPNSRKRRKSADRYPVDSKASRRNDMTLDSPQKTHRSRSPASNRYQRNKSPPGHERVSKNSSSMHADSDAAMLDDGSKRTTDEGDPESRLIKKVMGFSGFRSTKNTKVPGNNVGTVRKDKQIVARQYMNRVGGFNRPLSPTR